MCANRTVRRLAKSGSAIECANRSSMADLTPAAQSSKRQSRPKTLERWDQLSSAVPQQPSTSKARFTVDLPFGSQNRGLGMAL